MRKSWTDSMSFHNIDPQFGEEWYDENENH